VGSKLRVYDIINFTRLDWFFEWTFKFAITSKERGNVLISEKLIIEEAIVIADDDE